MAGSTVILSFKTGRCKLRQAALAPSVLLPTWDVEEELSHKASSRWMNVGGLGEGVEVGSQNVDFKETAWLVGDDDRTLAEVTQLVLKMGWKVKYSKVAGWLWLGTAIFSIDRLWGHCLMLPMTVLEAM